VEEMKKMVNLNERPPSGNLSGTEFQKRKIEKQKRIIGEKMYVYCV